MQPGANAPILFQCVRPSSEDEEDRLERIVAIGLISENSAASPVNEGTMALDQGGKRVFVVLCQKSAEQSRIAFAFV
jgi:hypothetical protein